MIRHFNTICSIMLFGFLAIVLPAQTMENATDSPDGMYTAYTQEGNLYIQEKSSSTVTQLTHDTDPLVYNGYASWVYYEEILGRGSRYRAFYWSPDSKRIAFLRFDDNPVPEFIIFHSEGQHGYNEYTRYPKAGDPNPEVQLGIVDVATHQVTWVDEEHQKDQYTAWCFWDPESAGLYFQELNRSQDTLRIYQADPASGHKQMIWEETSPAWVEFYENMYFLSDNQGFLLNSERSGWNNIYWHKPDGSVVNLTPGERATSNADYVDDQGNVYFGYSEGINRYYGRSNLKHPGIEPLVNGEGTHFVRFNAEEGNFSDRYSDFYHPWVTRTYDLNGKPLDEAPEATPDANAQTGIRVELRTVLVDGFDLPVRLVFPSDFDPNKKYPILFNVYGGPRSQSVRNFYQDFTNDDQLAQGVIKVTFDHRGSGLFGRQGLDQMHRQLGKWEISDLIAVVKALEKETYVDPERVGIQGGSYGGYYTALALTAGAGYITHGIASFPVTDWRLYDNIYTERYMDTPQENPDGYDAGSVMTYADQLKGRLLIIHGTADDNVHVQNSLQLIDKLEDLDKPFEMMFYPGERHGWGGPKRKHSQALSERFWSMFLGAR
ncbi:MAG TPA: DPP IV N-terminal domain-containing protein [Saprospiraceae bacterium]|nr:DPP IV N-terminal domain-containing protein [Saprospiraceae bacterium]